MYTEGDKENTQPRRRIVSSSQGVVDRERHKQQASPFLSILSYLTREADTEIELFAARRIESENARDS